MRGFAVLHVNVKDNGVEFWDGGREVGGLASKLIFSPRDEC